MTIRWLALCSAALLAGSGCGPSATLCETGDTRCECGGPCSGGDKLLKIEVTPDGVLKEVNLDAEESVTICYHARGVTQSGASSDITHTALWTTDRAVGSFAGSCLTTSTNLTAGGIVKVRASLGGAFGVALLAIKLDGASENDGVGRGQFAGPPNPDPASRPRIVYPLDGSIHARNITQMNIQFHAGAGNEVFMARVTSPQMEYTATFKPTRCDGDRCQWQVPEKIWQVVALTNGGATAKLALSGAGSAAGALVALSDGVQLTFSPDDVKGALYYFSTSLPGIMRLPFDQKAGTKATPFIIPDSSSNPKRCAGCHTVDFKDGDKIAATYGNGDDFLGIASAADATKFSLMPPPGSLIGDHCGPDQICSNFQSFNKSGTKLISNFGGELILRDGTTGAELSKVPPDVIGPPGSQRAVMPEWSHDDQRVAFVRLLPSSGMFPNVTKGRGNGRGGDWLIANAGEIATLQYDGTGFSSVKVIVPLGEGNDYNYYPTWSPDDQWIIFDTGSKPGFSPCAQGVPADCHGDPTWGVPADKVVSYDQKTSRLRMVRATGGGVVELARATMSAGTTASWPKFTPFVQMSGKLMFFTYSSKVDYGFVVAGGRQPQLWMSAVDLSRLGETSSDPSFAPAWLPFQDEKEANHLAVWTTKFICDKKECPSEFTCVEGQCVSCDIDSGCKAS